MGELGDFRICPIDLKHNGKAKVDRSGSEERRISRAVDQGAGLVARVVVGGGQSPSGIAGVSRFRPLPEFGVAAKAPDYPARRQLSCQPPFNSSFIPILTLAQLTILAFRARSSRTPLIIVANVFSPR